MINIRLAKADFSLIEKAIVRDMENDVSHHGDSFSMIHTTDTRIEKLVAAGLFEAIAPATSGRRSTGYALTSKGRAAFNQLNQARE